MSGLPLAWTSEGRDDYLYWQTRARKTLRRINLLIAGTQRDDPFEGIGRPEPLRHALAGAWSRRIDDANRLVYVTDETHVTVLQARYHY